MDHHHQVHSLQEKIENAPVMPLLSSPLPPARIVELFIDLDAAILDRHGSLLARVAEAALRMQRVRRLRALPRAARRLRRRQRSALALQRCFRGLLGRRYAEAWRVVSCLAATRMSAGWRMTTQRSKFLVLRARARVGATMMQVT